MKLLLICSIVVLFCALTPSAVPTDKIEVERNCKASVEKIVEWMLISNASHPDKWVYQLSKSPNCAKCDLMINETKSIKRWPENCNTCIEPHKKTVEKWKSCNQCRKLNTFCDTCKKHFFTSIKQLKTQLDKIHLKASSLPTDFLKRFSKGPRLLKRTYLTVSKMRTEYFVVVCALFVACAIAKPETKLQVSKSCKSSALSLLNWLVAETITGKDAWVLQMYNHLNCSKCPLFADKKLEKWPSNFKACTSLYWDNIKHWKSCKSCENMNWYCNTCRKHFTDAMKEHKKKIDKIVEKYINKIQFV
ncbi:unnamed protein product [Rodentolepis nana]|uniref:Uncharacterized protein n=1 Tax=Rodentolepis nana TaxID=102285 RepID=A0A0R3TTP4_RODNA|nr:unnamed protein product [Rodentolepis nana]